MIDTAKAILDQLMDRRPRKAFAVAESKGLTRWVPDYPAVGIATALHATSRKPLVAVWISQEDFETYPAFAESIFPA
jgi:hypothetical protein